MNIRSDFFIFESSEHNLLKNDQIEREIFFILLTCDIRRRFEEDDGFLRVRNVR